MFLQLLLGVIDVLIGFVLKIDSLFGGLIGLLGSLGFLDHAVDVGVGQATAGADGDLLRLAGGFVLGGDVHDTIGINVEGNFDLGDTTGSHRDSLKIEISKLLVILSEFTLTLENSDSDLGLVVSCGGEDLTLLGWDRGVSGDESGEDSTHGLNTEGEGSNIKKEDILDITGEDGSLNSGTNGDSFIGVNTSVGQLVKEVLDSLTNLWDTGRTTNHNDLVNLVLGKTRVLEASFEGLESFVDLSFNETLEFSACHLDVQMLGTSVIESKIGNANGCVGG